MGTFRGELRSRRELFLGEKAQEALRLTYRSSFSSRAGSNPGGPLSVCRSLMRWSRKETSDILIPCMALSQ
jgi:hypothetical protein